MTEVFCDNPRHVGKGAELQLYEIDFDLTMFDKHAVLNNTPLQWILRHNATENAGNPLQKYPMGFPKEKSHSFFPEIGHPIGSPHGVPSHGEYAHGEFPPHGVANFREKPWDFSFGIPLDPMGSSQVPW